MAGGGSVKGRVIGRRESRATNQLVIGRVGICQWCGSNVHAPKDVDLPCPDCGAPGDEVDWPTPPPAPPPHQPSLRNADRSYCPGVLSLSLLGATVYGRR